MARIGAQQISEMAMAQMEKGLDWTVHSIFSNGINLNCEKQLIFMGEAGNPTSPFGISFSKDDFQKMKTLFCEDMTFSTGNREKGQFYNEKLQISIGNAPILRYVQDRIKVEKNALKWYTELVRFLVKEGAAEEESEFWRMMTQRASKAMDGRCLEKGQAYGELRGMIGCGPGLTPAADDFLMGCMWVFFLLGQHPCGYMDLMGEVLAKENLTTTVSYNYFMCALKGNFSDSLLKLAQPLERWDRQELWACTENLLDTGHTSGRDTLRGILFALERGQ